MFSPPLVTKLGDEMTAGELPRYEITIPYKALQCMQTDTLALATGTRVGASDHAIARFCIQYGRVLGVVLRYITFCGLIMRIIVCFIYVVVMRSL